MAKTTHRDARSNSKIRFILLEADLGDGDLSEITQAISNAVMRTGTSTQRLIAAPVNGAPSRPALEPPADLSQEDGIEADNPNEEEAARATRSPKQRKISTPKVLDVDLNGGDVPFATFAQDKAPSTDLARHLVIAYWFKHQRGTDGVTAAHAYTCYKKMSWSTSIRDFAQPFRDLARKGKGQVKKGVFTINHLGEDDVAQDRS